MNLLALDTSSAACSVSISINGKKFSSHSIEPKNHTRSLIPMIEDILVTVNTRLTDLDAIVLGVGPGSFIGMRIGASVAQGLAFASNLRIIPISSMEAIALEALEAKDLDHIIVVQDAKMNEIYVGEYKLNKTDMIELISPIRLHSIDREIILDKKKRIGVTGFGLSQYPQVFQNNDSLVTFQDEFNYPKASYLITLGEIHFSSGNSVKPENLILDYIRYKVTSDPKH